MKRGQEGSTEDSAIATPEGKPMGAHGERLGDAGVSSPHLAGGRSLQSPGGLVAPVSSLRSREKWGSPSPRWAPGEGSTGKQGSSLEALASRRMLAYRLTPPAAGLHQGPWNKVWPRPGFRARRPEREQVTLWPPSAGCANWERSPLRVIMWVAPHPFRENEQEGGRGETWSREESAHREAEGPGSPHPTRQIQVMLSNHAGV